MLGTELMQAFASTHTTTGLDIAELDITDRRQCAARVEDLQPEVIINAAALTAVDYCETHEEEAFLVNAEGAGNLAVAAAYSGALLVHYSTDYVFDGTRAEPYCEEDPTGPRSVYGRSKLRGEEMVRLSGTKHLILRTAWLFGCHGKNFIRTILQAAREHRPLRVVDDQRGSPTYARDLAACTVKLVSACCRGTYHVTNRGACSWYELARFSVDCSGIKGVTVSPVPSSEYPRPAARPANSVLVNARLEREGFGPLRPWQEAVREYIYECG